MSTFIADRKRLPLAAAISMILATQAYAQDAQRTGLEEVVVTGSLIRGTPEDAALPVEVFNTAELEELGGPSPLEFVKSLPISGATTGEAYYFGSSILTNDVRYNLRGIGRDKTLTLFNGRRAFQNSVVYPSGAIERIEILKDGAAVTYGADATGGVVNVITKDNFDGVEVAGSYKSYDGSEDGEWKVGATAGFNTEFANLLFAVEWDHRSELDTSERSFSRPNHAQNPAPTSTLTNLSAWSARGPRPATPSGQTADDEFGPSLGTRLDFNQQSCEAVGGIYNTTSCIYNYMPYYNLVEENDVHRVFAQLTSKLSDSADFHLRALWARNYSPHQYGSPSQPVVRGPARATGLTHQLYIPIENPYALEFAQRTGWVNNAAFADTDGFTAATYRAFAHGGNGAFATGDNHSTPNENEAKYTHITAGVSGEAATWLNYDIGATFNHRKVVNSQPDILGFRLQNALNGFGGPNCNAPDLDPTQFGIQNPGAAGQNGCLWYNPFATSFAAQPTLGLSNPNFRAGSQNPVDLVRWLFNKREWEENRWDFTFDVVFSGETPLALPGGNVAWGLGAQYRNTKIRETVEDPLYNGQTPCDWPGQNPAATTDPAFTGCTLDESGPYLFFANNPPDAAHQNQQSYFLEVGLPILDSLNLTLAGRYEKFEPIGLDATVYKVSGKWQIVDQFALRASYGTNYQAPFVDGTTGRAIIPGNLFNTVASFTRAGGAWLGSQEFTRSDIEPETATVKNFGAIAQFEFGVDQELQVTLDYFDIRTQDELGLVSPTNEIANAIFDPVTRVADCNHPLIGRVTFNDGGCSSDPANPSTAANFASIRTDYGNGPGKHTAGLDFQLHYGIGVGPGRLQTSLNVTRVLENEETATVLDGFVVKPAEDRLGYLNFATVGDAQSEWRGNFNLNYSFGDHNIRAVLNYVSGVDDERYIRDDGSINTALLVPAGFQPGTTDRFGVSTYGVFGEDWKTGDIHYLWRAPWATLGVSVVNVTNEDPPQSRQEFGYDPRIGNALGRQFEVSLRKQF